MEKCKVLIFIDWFTPGYKAGGPTTSNMNIVEHLKDQFDFYIVTSNTDYHEQQSYEDIQSDTWIEKNGTHIYYFSKKQLSFFKLKQVVKKNDCSTWYINGIYSKYYSIYPLFFAKLLKPAKVIVSARGMLSPHALAIKTIFKKTYLCVASMIGLFEKVKFHATNIEEAAFIKKSIGFETSTFPIENLPRKIHIDFFLTGKQKGEIKLVSFARISPEKNTLFAIRCLKTCRQTVFYDIYGQINSNNYWADCQKEIAMLPCNVTVHYKGTISPEQMSQCYRNYHMLYLPSTGENFGHAILESFMNSCPVIISDRTPWRNLQDKHIGWDLPLGNQEEFAEMIDHCAILSSEEYEEMARKAYLYADNIIQNDSVKQQYIKLFSI